MSELINAHADHANFHRQLLTTVSALTLLAAVYGTSEAKAADQDADRPTVWVELGGQLEQMNNSQEAFSPPFMASITQASLFSALNVQQPPTYAIDGEGKISFQRDDSDWVFGASIKYGRSAAQRHRHQQTANPHIPVHFSVYGKYFNQSVYPHYYNKMADGQASTSEEHLVLDFQAGKDVGLGLFGGHGTSVISAGIRIAQFASKGDVTLRARPDVHYPSKPVTSVAEWEALFKYPRIFHNYTAIANSQRSFRGIGPSLAWNASMPFAGNPQSGQMTFDWGANAAVLFGRQKARGHHQTTSRFYSNLWYHHYVISNPTPHVTGKSFNRARTVTVPNLGGFAGLSFLYSNAKVSFGYRGDFFFGAMDGGIDIAKKENRGFYGPFAAISIGIGG